MFFSESVNYGNKNEELDIQASETGLTGDATGVYRMVSESTEEWYNLREKMMKLEHTAIVSEDAALLSEGAKDFFGKISKFFEGLLARVKEIWAKFVKALNEAVNTDKMFVKKYSSVIRNKSLAGFTTKGRKWKTGELGASLKFESLLKLASGFMRDVTKVHTPEQVKSFRASVDGADFENKTRGALLGAGSVEANSFKSAVEKTFYEGDGEAVELSASDVPAATLLDVVGNASKSIKDAQKEEKAVEALLTEAIKFYNGIAHKMEAPRSDKTSKAVASTRDGGEIRELEHDGKKASVKGTDHNIDIKGGGVRWKEESDGSSDSRVSQREAATLSAQACRKVSTVATTAFGFLLEGIRARRNEYRSILAKMATHGSAPKEDKGEDKGKGKEDETKSESADLTQQEETQSYSILDRF